MSILVHEYMMHGPHTRPYTHMHASTHTCLRTWLFSCIICTNRLRFIWLQWNDLHCKRVILHSLILLIYIAKKWSNNLCDEFASLPTTKFRLRTVPNFAFPPIYGRKNVQHQICCCHFISSCLYTSTDVILNTR